MSSFFFQITWREKLKKSGNHLFQVRLGYLVFETEMIYRICFNKNLIRDPFQKFVHGIENIISVFVSCCLWRFLFLEERCWWFNSRTTWGRCHSLLVNNIFMTSLIAFSLFTVKKRPAFNISHLKLSFESITLTVLENDTYRGLPSLKTVEPPTKLVPRVPDPTAPSSLGPRGR